MKTILALALLAALGAATAVPATTVPATETAPTDLATATGQTGFGTYYCEKLADRCDAGDANACQLHRKHCSD